MPLNFLESLPDDEFGTDITDPPESIAPGEPPRPRHYTFEEDTEFMHVLLTDIRKTQWDPNERFELPFPQPEKATSRLLPRILMAALLLGAGSQMQMPKERDDREPAKNMAPVLVPPVQNDMLAWEQEKFRAPALGAHPRFEAREKPQEPKILHRHDDHLMDEGR
jgi:hypothetical protein